MNQFLFKSRWIALGFVALTLLGVYLLVGGKGDAGLLARVSSDLAHQHEETASRVAQLEAPAQPDEAAPADDAGEDVFMDDEDLIDRAEGYDPTPDVVPGQMDSVPDEIVIDEAPAPRARPSYAPDGVPIIAAGN